MKKGKYEKWLTEQSLTLLEGWARSGLTDQDIAKNIGISRSTLNVWRERFPQIANAISAGKEVADYAVENALFRRAVGYETEEETLERLFDKTTGKFEMRVTKTVRKRVAPDTVAAIFWLKNRRPDKWRDRAEENSGAVNNEFVDAWKKAIINAGREDRNA